MKNKLPEKIGNKPAKDDESDLVYEVMRAVDQLIDCLAELTEVVEAQTLGIGAIRPKPMSHTNNKEVRLIKEWQTRFDELFPTLSVSTKSADKLGYDLVHRTKEVKEFLHQELQKARHDWLREEIVNLEKIKDEMPITNKPFELSENVGKMMFIDELIQRYQSELDQPK